MEVITTTATLAGTASDANPSSLHETSSESRHGDDGIDNEMEIQGRTAAEKKDDEVTGENVIAEAVDDAVTPNIPGNMTTAAENVKVQVLSIDTSIANEGISENRLNYVDESAIVITRISDGLTSDNILTAKRTPKTKRHDDEEYEPLARSTSHHYELDDIDAVRYSDKKLKTSKHSAFDDQRSGKWTVDEENFANQLVKDFERGFLDDCEEGITLRSYLARRLNCAPMRISKKFSGRCIGKLSYVKCDASYESEKLKSPLSRLEEIYIQSYSNKKNSKSRRNSRNSNDTTGSGNTSYRNPDYTYSDYDDNEVTSTCDDYEGSANSSDTDTYNKNPYRYESATRTSLDPLTLGFGFDDNFDSSLDQVYDDKEAVEWKAVLLSLTNSTMAKMNNIGPSIKSEGPDISQRINNRGRTGDNIQEQGMQRSSSSASLLV